jgi:hypothetical protein
MALSGVLDAVQGKFSFLVNDDEIAEAANNCYAALCHNQQNKSAWGCSLKLSDVGHIIWAYINYFVTNPDQNAKYYFDEANDRSDSYRKKLVERIGQTVSKDADFTNSVLSYLYWGIKRGKVAKGILRPREVAKFKNPDYWYKGVLGGLFKISVEVVRFAEQVLKSAGYVVSSTTQLVADALHTVGNLGRGIGNNLGLILGIGAVGFVGFQVWKYKKTGEILGVKR